MQRLDCSALVHELHDATSLAAGYTQRMGYVMLVEAQHQRSGERGCKRPADRGELKSMPGEGSRRGKSDAHKDFPSQHEGAEQLGPGCANILAHRKRRRRHHRSGMHDGGGMSAVILKRVHQRAVAQRCRRRCNRSRETKRRRSASRPEHPAQRVQRPIPRQ